jgi:hypothetical protein
MPREPLLKCKYLGQYFIQIMMFYSTSLSKFGANLIAASALNLVLRIGGFPFNWCDYLQTLTGFSKSMLNECCQKMCQKYLDLHINHIDTKRGRI